MKKTMLLLCNKTALTFFSFGASGYVAIWWMWELDTLLAWL